MFKDTLRQCLKDKAAPRTRNFSQFIFTFELVPARASRGKVVDDIIRFAQEAASVKRISALSITDNAGGHPALTPQALGSEIKSMGIAPVIHFSCKDKNRNRIESELFELDRAGLNTLLVLTGDNPRYGYMGRAKPVFDLDSVLVLAMIQEMRHGLVVHKKAPGGGVRLPKMDFYSGCVVSPFKRTFPEQIFQYLKLRKKLQAGAQFIISQMGYDVRKYQELALILQKMNFSVPLLGTVLIPTVGLARIIHKNVIPGCTVPTRLLEQMEKWPTERALELRLDIAAKLVAILYGLGYHGVHLSGPGLEYKHVHQVIEMAHDHAADWQKYVDDFLFPEEWQSFLFQEDPSTGLNSNKLNSFSRDYKETLSPPYLIGKIIHALFFEPDRGLFNTAKRLVKKCHEKGCISWLTSFEYFFKELLYQCQRCGDCYLGDLEFLCPQSQCAKKLVNGPCGGSNNGWCEVWPEEKRCLFVRLFNRASWNTDILFKDQEIIPPRDWALDRQSSWLNFYLGRDHNHKTMKSETDED